jgi:hypothetical protein
MRRRIKVTEGTSPTRADTVMGMNRAWTKIFLTYPKVAEKLSKAMKEHEVKRIPFNFQRWLVQNRDLLKKLKDTDKFYDRKNARVRDVVPSSCMEGHEPLPQRLKAMRNAGFAPSRYYTPLHESANPYAVGSLLYLVTARKAKQRRRR